jgi:[NiFe] hydrogenase large subunit
MAAVGKGPANYLAWGVFEDQSYDPKKRFLPRGVLLASDFPKVHDAKREDVLEHTSRGWYKDAKPLNPSEGVTAPEFTVLNDDQKYTWAKAPRLNGQPMEVGALARMMVAYASGNPGVQKITNDTLAALGQAGKPQVLMSVLGRIATRALECKLVVDQMEQWGLELIENIKSGKTATYTDYEIPDTAQGAGLWEAPRGALGHWIDVSGKRIKNYQAVVPSTWNCSPRDDNGVRGPLESALVGISVENAEKPLEVLRVAHSFDPCLACTVHVIHPDSNRIMKFKVS